MWRNSITSLIFLISLTYCAIVPEKGVTFKNVRVLVTRISKWDINITETNSLKEHLPKEDKLAQVELVGNIPKLYENSITDIDNLIKLQLKDNYLYEIQPGAFKNLSKLSILSIRENELKEIKKGVFYDLPIEELNLDHNNIEIIEDGAFSNMPNLRSIDLANNQIKNWNQNWFGYLPELRTIFITRNGIEELPDEAFNNLIDPTHPLFLWFSFNEIKKINKYTFKNLNEVTIDLEGNRIEDLEEDWSDGTTVEELDISDNRLTCLQGDFDKIFTAKYTDIDRNPWDCGCLKKLVEYAKNNNKQIEMEKAKDKCGL